MSGKEGRSISWFNSTAVPVKRYFLFSSLALILIFAWMEPAGAAGIGLWKGIIFWTIQISILIPLLISTQHFTSHLVSVRSARAPWIQTLLAGIFAAILFVPIAYLLDIIFAIPDDSSGIGILPGLLDEASGLIVPVTTTWIALNAPWIFQLDFSTRQSETVAKPQVNSQEQSSGETGKSNRFLQELRSRATGELISISSELHYLRVTTTDDEIMFLYNLKDAVDELPSNSGVQIHRSHWVCTKQVKQLVKKSGYYECILSNGKRLPVSRRKYAEVKDLLAPEIS